MTKVLSKVSDIVITHWTGVRGRGTFAGVREEEQSGVSTTSKVEKLPNQRAHQEFFMVLYRKSYI